MAVDDRFVGERERERMVAMMVRQREA